ncbi:hypothetical protein SSTU70S_05301 [Stutzerimonas stutzeri]
MTGVSVKAESKRDVYLSIDAHARRNGVRGAATSSTAAATARKQGGAHGRRQHEHAKERGDVLVKVGAVNTGQQMLVQRGDEPGNRNTGDDRRHREGGARRQR